MAESDLCLLHLAPATDCRRVPYTKISTALPDTLRPRHCGPLLACGLHAKPLSVRQSTIRPIRSAKPPDARVQQITGPCFGATRRHDLYQGSSRRYRNIDQPLCLQPDDPGIGGQQRPDRRHEKRDRGSVSLHGQQHFGPRWLLRSGDRAEHARRHGCRFRADLTCMGRPRGCLYRTSALGPIDRTRCGRKGCRSVHQPAGIRLSCPRKLLCHQCKATVAHCRAGTLRRNRRLDSV